MKRDVDLGNRSENSNRSAGPPQYGKVGSEFFARVIYRNLGASRRSVLVGPNEGFDNGIISLGGGEVLVLTSDPVSIIPSMGMQESARISVHHLASDFMTSGLKPQFAAFDFNLPLELEVADLEDYIKSLGRECRKLGISIVAGHTGWYPGSGFTVVGGGVLFGLGGEAEYVTPAMANSRDDVLITKGAAVEATGILARAFPDMLKARIGSATWRRAASYISKTTCVEDARIAAGVGLRSEGVTSMHDATEGGVLGGLSELAEASRKPLIIEPRKIFVSAETRQICATFGLDPLTTLTGGTLIITCVPKRTEELVSRLSKNGIPNFVIGKVGVGGRRGIWESRAPRKPRFMGSPGRDRYWEAYDRAMRNGMAQL